MYCRNLVVISRALLKASWVPQRYLLDHRPRVHIAIHQACSSWCYLRLSDGGEAREALNGGHCVVACCCWRSTWSRAKPSRRIQLLSRGIKRDKLQGTNGAKFALLRRFSLIFADYRFSQEFQYFGGADFRRKPQNSAGNCRFLQKPVCPIQFVPFNSALF